VLSRHEQQVWEEIERRYGAQAEEVVRVHLDRDARPDRGATHVEDVLSALVTASAVVIGVSITIVLVALGALVSGATVGLATVLMWLHLRSSPQSRGSRRASPWSAMEGISHSSRDTPPTVEKP